METSDRDVLFTLLLSAVGLLLVSHLSWHITTAVVCPAQYPVTWRCFFGSILGMWFGVVAIPSGIYFVVSQLLFGIESHGTNTMILGVLFAALLFYRYHRALFEFTTNAASLVAATPDIAKTKAKAAQTAKENKSVKQETEREEGRTDLEEAIREMEEAKARLDALKRDQS